MNPEWWPYLLGAVLLIVLPVFFWLSLRTDRRFRKELSSRSPLGDSEFVRTYYADSDIAPDIPIRLRPIYADFFELDHLKLVPSDRPPGIVEVDNAPLVEAIESEFDVKISDSAAEQIDGSFQSIVDFLGEATAA